MDIKEPTRDQCSEKQKVYETDSQIGYACWYPQMGGYVGKAVAVFDKQWGELKNQMIVGRCVDVLIWHDGNFPFSDESPVELHHCCPYQFISFGEFLEEILEQTKVDEL